MSKVTAERHETPSGPRYIFRCEHGHAHEARHDAATCQPSATLPATLPWGPAWASDLTPSSITPGPWRAMPDGYIVSEDGEGCLVARVETENAASQAVVDADARAIAEVPAMLALLRAMTAHADRHNTRDPQNISEARALLARVRGVEGR
jgi:hypothetical protein